MTSRPRSPATRSPARPLVFTVWLVYSLFATTNVVRETYLAITLGANRSVRVDRYLGLHPDLFEIPGRGAYINSNPGASMLGAVPYGLLVHPAISLVVRLKPGIAQPRPPATYDDPRPNRNRFLNASRERGLDIVLGLAAIGTAVTLMAPLGALAAVLMFVLLRHRLDDERTALTLTLVFAFATPMIFRSAFLNQNLLVGHLVFVAFLLQVGVRPRAAGAGPSTLALAGIGACLGFALVCDYSAFPIGLVFGAWIARDAWHRGGTRQALRSLAVVAVAGAIAVAPLAWYQWAAFGSPLWPAQRYMPPTEFSVRGWFGFTPPTLSLLAGNLFDPRYGLFAFSPLLLSAFALPWVAARSSAWRREWPWIAASFVALLVFSSMNQFANLQWNTGVRYMTAVLPLLFVASVPVLLAMPRVARWTLITASTLITAAVTMTREDPAVGLRMLFTEGPTLPLLIVLRKTGDAYGGVTVGAWVMLPLMAVIGAVLYAVWRPYRRSRLAPVAP